MAATTKNGTHICEGCGAFLRSEPTEIVDNGVSYGEDGPEWDGLTLTRTCGVCGTDNDEVVYYD